VHERTYGEMAELVERLSVWTVRAYAALGIV
jgi:hypothetical protein